MTRRDARSRPARPQPRALMPSLSRDVPRVPACRAMLATGGLEDRQIGRAAFNRERAAGRVTVRQRSRANRVAVAKRRRAAAPCERGAPRTRRHPARGHVASVREAARCGPGDNSQTAIQAAITETSEAKGQHGATEERSIFRGRT